MSLTPQQARTTLMAVRALLATSWLTPNLTARAFGIDPSANVALPYLVRLFAAREAYMAVQLLEGEGEQLDRALQLGIGVDALDVAAAGLAAAGRTLPPRATALAGGTAALAVWLGIRARQG